MNHDVLYKPSYALLRVNLAAGEQVVAEAGALVAMSPNIQVKTLLNPNPAANSGFFGRLFGFFAALLKALLRKVFGGESFFVNRFEPAGGEGEVLLAPAVTGDIIHQRIEGRNLIVQASSYLASSGDVQVKMKFGGLKGLFSGEGVFLLEIGGTGDVWLNAYGGIEEIRIDGSYVVDTGHIVAFESSLDYRIKGVGGLKSTLISGEGLVMEFNGTGTLWIQTRNLPGFVNWVASLLPR